MQDIPYPKSYQRQPIRRSLKALVRGMLWADRKLSGSRVKPFALSFFASILFFTGSIYAASPWYELVVNKSESLPGTLFILNKTRPPHCGDTTAFDMPVDARFYRGARMIKMVQGCMGDVITVQDHEVFLNGQSMGKFMDYSTQGHHPLFPVQAGVIPANRVYLYAPHPQSYDSRYRSYGLRDRAELLGTATRIF